MMKGLLQCLALGLFLLVGSYQLAGQSCNVPIGSQTEFIVDRLLIKHNNVSHNIHTALKPYKRQDVVSFLLELSKTEELSQRDVSDIQYILDDNNDLVDDSILQKINTQKAGKVYVDSTELFYTYKEGQTNDTHSLHYKTRPAVLKYFFKTPANFLELNYADFSLRINPIINIKFGIDVKDSDKIIFQNTRGVEVKGLIDNKIYFYTNLIENQGTFNNYILQSINKYKAIPGHGSYKIFDSRVSDKLDGYDFPNSQAYFGLNISKHVSMELGHGKHFIGNGYRSLLLSDFAHNYFYLKLSTNIWKFHYQNIFAELAPISSNYFLEDGILPKKYMANHTLSFKASNKFQVSLFETVIFSRQDHFEFQYLNPIVFYRSVEFFLNSPDNILLGLNVDYSPIKNVSFYGQMILDEFKLDELTSGTGWWANKYGFQVGAKYYDVFGIEDLTAQLEYNIVRPYTYDHRDTLGHFDISVANYSHFNQPLAHPLGANFKELVLNLSYKPFNRLTIKNQFLITNYGEDTDGQNWGGDILIPYQIGNDLNLPQEYNNTIGQGTKTDIFQWKVDLTYQFFHNYYIDIHLLRRVKNSADDAYDLNTNYLGAGVRANISDYKMDY